MHFIKKGKLLLKYVLLWFFTGIVCGILVLFPQSLNILSNLLEIQLPVNSLFLVGIGFSIILIMSLTMIVSNQTERIRKLAQDNAMLEKRIRELEKVLQNNVTVKENKFDELSMDKAEEFDNKV